MLILPLHQPITRATLPWATLLLVLLNLWVFVALQGGDSQRREQADSHYWGSGMAAIEAPLLDAHLQQHPDPELATLFIDTNGNVNDGYEDEYEFPDGLVFGNFQQATKSGRKYEDLNADGDDEGGTDPALSGWTILAFAEIGVADGVLSAAEIAAGAADSDVTDASGAYSLTLDPGSYIVVEQVSDQAGSSSARTG